MPARVRLHLITYHKRRKSHTGLQQIAAAKKKCLKVLICSPKLKNISISKTVCLLDNVIAMIKRATAKGAVLHKHATTTAATAKAAKAAATVAATAA